ncbi:MAG TPA: M23 family metallopeptidase [Acidobacteriota bacterium]|nr:M23 family metallopeptidase [Acidobacteriota bacterium]
MLGVEAPVTDHPEAGDGESPAGSRLELRDVRAAAFGSQVRGYRRDEGRWEVLLGIDLDVKPGTYPVEVTALLEESGPDSGRTLRTQHVLWIEDKTFPTRKLTVAPKYVDPPPETQERIARESRLLVDLFHTSTPQRYWRGEFVAPVPGRVNRDSFGKRSIFNGKPRSPHTGADFSAPSGTPVKAPNAGKVVLARDLYFAGRTVILDHGLGLYSFFAHLSEFKVDEGQMVERGEVLGLTGSTGRVTGPHLHYAVRLDNARVDPLALMELLGPEAH